MSSVEAGLGRIRPSMDEAARSMGYRPLAIARYVHIPMLRGSLPTALLLVLPEQPWPAEELSLQ